MAGGPHAAVVPCWRCAGPAARIHDGLETDWFLCADCEMRFGINFEEGTPPDEPMWPPAPAWALATVRTFGQAWRGTPGYRSFLRRRIVRLAGGSPETPETASLSSLVGDRVAVIDLFGRLHEELGCGFSSQSWVRAADAETLGDVVGFFAAQEPWESQGDR